MSTRIHNLIPRDIYFIPDAADVARTVSWLISRIEAYKIVAVTPGHLIFFDCGGGLDTVCCPICGADIGDPLWKDWMDTSYSQTNGFTLSTRTLACCGSSVQLDQLVFDAPCAFGSFAIEITDTMATLTDEERADLLRETEMRLGCPLIWIDAHY